MVPTYFLFRSLPATDASAATRWHVIFQNGRTAIPATAIDERPASTTTVPAEPHVP